MLTTTITGSLPKPAWLAESGVLFAPWRVPAERLPEAHDDAVRLALADQEEAGIDIVTDGEQRRRHYIWGFLSGLTGFDLDRLGRRQSRGGRYAPETDAARLVGEVSRPHPVLVDAVRFAKAHTRHPVKVTLPGPLTIVDSIVDEYYRADEKTLAMRFAGLLNDEARDLAAAGADVIQFDEPTFNVYLETVEAWGVEALERCINKVDATTAVHICYGYGIPIVLQWKTRNREWGHYAVTLPLLVRSGIGQVSVELAASGVDPAVLTSLAGKDVMAGVIDVGTEEAETPEVVAERIRRVLPYVEPQRLYPSTDCGLVPRSRAAARRKLRALAAGAAIVREELRAGDRQRLQA
jgi:5-methyltetrahydropteroyltriglutamate--homocysteine methyltransferase